MQHTPPTENTKDSLKGITYALIAVIIWSGWVVVSRLGVTGTLSAFDLTAIRFLVAGCILLPFWLPHCRRYGWRHHLRSIQMAGMMGAPYVAIVLHGIHYSSVAHASMMQAMSVISTYICSYFLLRQTPKLIQVIGVSISVMGICWILLEGLWTVNIPNAWLGHLLLVAGGTLWGLYITCVKAWKLPALQAATEVAVWSLFLYVPLYFIFSPTTFLSAPLFDIGLQALYQGVFASIISMIVFTKAIHLLGPTKASAFIPLIPALSTLLAIPLLGEHPTTMAWTGIAMISLGILLSTGLISKTNLKRWFKI